ncbi:MAG: hypothetical protein R2708_28335 [Vicinamibacterales bacterium]
MAIDDQASYNGDPARSRGRSPAGCSRTIVDAGFVFEGGNLAFDRVGDRTRVFIGYNDVPLTIDNYRRQGRALDLDGVVIMAADFGGAEVRWWGARSRARSCSTSTRRSSCSATVWRSSTASSGRRRASSSKLEATRSQARAARLPDHRHRPHAVGGRELPISTNAVPFVDATTGRRTVVFPVFPGECGTPEGRLSVEHLKGKALAAYRAYLAAGYQPVPVRDFAHALGGNTHCIANVSIEPPAAVRRGACSSAEWPG